MAESALKLRCPTCQEASTLAGARSVDGLLEIECSECGASLVIAARSAETVDEKSPKPAEEDAGRNCPKCGEQVAESVEACPACGLAASRFDDYQREASIDDGALAESWAALESNWEDEEAHRALVEQAAARASYREVAALYREAAQDPARAERCRIMQERLRTMAAAAVLSTAPKKPKAEDEPYKMVLALLLGLLVIGAAVGVYVIIKSKAASEPEVAPSGVRNHVRSLRSRDR